MKILLVSDFNLQNFSGYLNNAGMTEGVQTVLAPFGQVQQTVLTPDPALWQPRSECCILWTRPESILPTFQALLEGKPASIALLENEVDDYARLIRQATELSPVVLVPSWVLPPHHSGHGLADLMSGSGPVRALMSANLRLAAALESIKGAYALSASKWIELAGPAAYNPRLWYGAKVPFGNDVFKTAARDVLSALRGIRGRARKLVLLDLDDTLWGGIVGDVGWDGLVLGGHDPEGEALVDFQKELKALSRRGIALGILSKNHEATALDAIKRHPEMVLQLDDFAGWRINWNDKAANLADLVRELNLGLDSVVFLDDNPVERARIRESFPQVLVPDLPEDKRLYAQTLLGLDCFNKPAITDEDRERVRMYTDERKRSEIRNSVSNLDEWLASLEIAVTASPLSSANLTRITQLLNKTNQMNLRTRRLTEPELLQWAAEPNHALWGFRVADRLGDSGLTGVLGIEAVNGRANITDLVLSCRVMGRRIEETMLQVGIDWARQAGCTVVEASLLPTSKNQPCAEFLRRSRLREHQTNQFLWEVAEPYPAASAIELVVENRGDESQVAIGRRQRTTR